MAVAAVEERELLKTISWFDGFVVALANPSFLITGLGASVLGLGGWGAVILWTASVIIGALHNYVYSELASMFPKLSGGIAIYAHEAWKKYLSFVGPLAAFGYWIGWSVVLSATGVVVGFLVQAQFYTSSAAAGSSWNHSGHLARAFPLYFSFPIALTIVIIAAIWTFNVLGMRPAVWVGYVTGGAAPDPARRDHVPALHHRRLALEQPALRDQLALDRRERRHQAGDRVAVRHVLVVVRHGVLRHVCARVPRHRPRHRQGAAGGGDLRRDRLRPPAAGRRRDVRRQERDHVELPRQLLRHHVP